MKLKITTGELRIVTDGTRHGMFAWREEAKSPCEETLPPDSYFIVVDALDTRYSGTSRSRFSRILCNLGQRVVHEDYVLANSRVLVPA